MIPSPKEIFQKLDKDAVAQLAQVCSEGWFQRSISTALAQMAFNHQSQEISGANAFISALYSLHAEKAEAKLPPIAKLDTYDLEHLRQIEEAARKELSAQS